MNSPLIVAICSTTGPSSGKSTYLENVVKPHLQATGRTYEHVRFSDPIVSFLCEGLHCLHGRGRDDYEALKRDELLPGITGRDFMIAAGDALRNSLNPSFYADIVKHRIQKSNTDAIIIDDLRKLKELDALQSLVNEGCNVLIVNVLKPHEPLNDCEFDTFDLRRFTWSGAGPERQRLMEVSWGSGIGSFKTLRYEFVNQTFKSEVT